LPLKTTGVLCRVQIRPRKKVKVLQGPENLEFFWPDLLRGASIITNLFAKQPSAVRYTICTYMYGLYAASIHNLKSHIWSWPNLFICLACRWHVTCVGLARTIYRYIQFLHGIFGREITECTVICYGYMIYTVLAYSKHVRFESRGSRSRAQNLEVAHPSVGACSSCAACVLVLVQ